MPEREKISSDELAALLGMFSKAILPAEQNPFLNPDPLISVARSGMLSDEVRRRRTKEEARTAKHDKFTEMVLRHILGGDITGGDELGLSDFKVGEGGKISMTGLIDPKAISSRMGGALEDYEANPFTGTSPWRTGEIIPTRTAPQRPKKEDFTTGDLIEGLLSPM
jgi:hypothetical protein